MRWLGLVAFCAVMGVIAVAGLAPRKTPAPDPVLEAWWRERDALRRAREAGL